VLSRGASQSEAIVERTTINSAAQTNIPGWCLGSACRTGGRCPRAAGCRFSYTRICNSVRKHESTRNPSERPCGRAGGRVPRGAMSGRCCSPPRGLTACQIYRRSCRCAQHTRDVSGQPQSIRSVPCYWRSRSAAGRLRRSARLHPPDRAAATWRRPPWGAEQARRVACSAAS
jgi:hypothetical protein